MTTETNQEKSKNIVVLFLGAAILVLIIIIFGRMFLGSGPTLNGLAMSEWDQHLLVLVRSENDHEFFIENTGEEEFSINNVAYLYGTGQDMLIAATVAKTEIFSGGNLVIQEKDERLEGDSAMTVLPGEDIVLVAFFHGEKLGVNKLVGIRIEFTLDGKEGQLDLPTPDTIIDVQ